MPSQRAAAVAVPSTAFPTPPANSKEQIDHEYVFCTWSWLHDTAISTALLGVKYKLWFISLDFSF